MFPGTTWGRWPGRDPGTERTTWFDGEMKMNSTLVRSVQYFRRRHGAQLSPTAHLPWKISTAWSDAPSCVSSVTNMSLLSRVWRERWAPLASLAPAVILYVPHISSYLPSFMWLVPAFRQWWSDAVSPLLSIRDPRVTKEVGGRWCVALFWWIFSVCTVKTE